MNENKKLSTISERMKTALSERRMKQIELSRLTGIDKGAINNYVHGLYKPKTETMKKIASALNVSEIWLLGFDVPMEREPSASEKEPLTERERLLLNLFNQVPEESQEMVLALLCVLNRR